MSTSYNLMPFEFLDLEKTSAVVLINTVCVLYVNIYILIVRYNKKKNILYTITNVYN